MLLHFVRNDGCPLWYITNRVHLTSVEKKFVLVQWLRTQGPCAQLSRCVFRMRELTSLLAFTSPRFTLAVVAVLVCLYPLYLIAISVVDVLMKPLGKRRRWKNGHAISDRFHHHPKCSSTFEYAWFVRLRRTIAERLSGEIAMILKMSLIYLQMIPSVVQVLLEVED